jgi:glutamate synthase (ferredoxin)
VDRRPHVTLKDLRKPSKNRCHRRRTREAGKVFGYTYEDLKTIILPMAGMAWSQPGPWASTTDRRPVRAQSDSLQFFKQLFAQVTNPPIDGLREEIITATETYSGRSAI